VKVKQNHLFSKEINNENNTINNNSPIITNENNNSIKPNNEITIESWLKSIGMSQYEKNFIDNGYDDLDVIKEYGLEDLDFESMGIKLPGHIKKFKMKIDSLKKNF
jgi:hypothetical protein